MPSSAASILLFGVGVGVVLDSGRIDAVDKNLAALLRVRRALAVIVAAGVGKQVAVLVEGTRGDGALNRREVLLGARFVDEVPEDHDA